MGDWRQEQLSGLTTALSYLRLGWAPIPLCWPRPDGRCACGRGHAGKDVGKAPLLGKGYQDVRPSKDDLRRWWSRWPQANVGLLLEPSKLLVGDGDGEAGVAELEAQRPLPVGPIARSGGGGQHRYYLAPSHVSGRATKRGQSHALDVLASGYVVVPPSLHRSGQPYEWLLSPWEVPPPPAPTWAVALLAGKADTSRNVAVPALPDDLPAVDLDALPISVKVRTLLRAGPLERQYPSRSEALFAAIVALVRASQDDATIAAAVWGSSVGEKARERGRGWLAAEIARARAKVAQGRVPRLLLPGRHTASVASIAAPSQPRGVPLPPLSRPRGVPAATYSAKREVQP
ncbi:MAG: bifunctional DNA primase/polymerase [Chloroflexota bacterium]